MLLLRTIYVSLTLAKYLVISISKYTVYNREGQFTIMWDDPEYNIKWPLKNPILSKRDGGK